LASKESRGGPADSFHSCPVFLRVAGAAKNVISAAGVRHSVCSADSIEMGFRVHQLPWAGNLASLTWGCGGAVKARGGRFSGGGGHPRFLGSVPNMPNRCRRRSNWKPGHRGSEGWSENSDRRPRGPTAWPRYRPGVGATGGVRGLFRGAPLPHPMGRSLARGVRPGRGRVQSISSGWR